jgi:hypothetical protein
MLCSYASNAKKVPKYIRDRFTNCYTGKNTHIRNLIEIDGYFELKELYRHNLGVGKNGPYSDTSNYNIVFYEDYTFLYMFHKTDSTPLQIGYWGIYRIEGDTIITQRIQEASLLSPWDTWEDRFVVINRHTIQILPAETRPLSRKTAADRKDISIYMAKRKFFPAQFKKSAAIPNPDDSWLKKQKWTWCK